MKVTKLFAAILSPQMLFLVSFSSAYSVLSVSLSFMRRLTIIFALINTSLAVLVTQKIHNILGRTCSYFVFSLKMILVQCDHNQKLLLSCSSTHCIYISKMITISNIHLQFFHIIWGRGWNLTLLNLLSLLYFYIFVFSTEYFNTYD